MTVSDLYMFSLDWVASFCGAQRSKGMVCRRISHPFRLRRKGCHPHTINLDRVLVRISHNLAGFLGCVEVFCAGPPPNCFQ